MCCCYWVQGYHGDEQDDKLLEEEAHKTGFPVMIKAGTGLWVVMCVYVVLMYLCACVFCVRF